MAITKRAVASAANEKPADGVVKINSVEEPKAKQKAEAVVATSKDKAAPKKASKPAAKKAPAKKPAAKAPAKKAAETKTAAAKKSTTAKPIEKKAAAAAKKTTTAAKKTTTVKKAAAKKPAAKKPAAKKAAASKASSVKTEITIQFNGRDYTKAEVDKIFEDVWKYDVGRKLSEVKKVDYYFKPEESAVYYVVDDGTEGRFEV
ncbi:MAG: DUF6465 family protein [Lachnospiraceae bacterium]|nr:DUF6465 family protein [Lachnospiraceae bacterium]